MKNTLLLLAVFLGFGAFAQNEKTTVIQSDGLECIIPPREIKVLELPNNLLVDIYYRAQLKKPIGEFHELKDWKLSYELPFMHTVNGVVYSFDFLRYRGRN